MKKLKDTLWDLYARFYDSLLYFYPYKELVGIVCSRAEEDIHREDMIVDIGSGTGNIALGLLKHNSEIHLKVVEPSKSMLQRAEKKIKSSYSNSDIQFFNADAEEFLSTIADRSIDMVVMNNVLYTILNREKFWELLSKKLSNSGVAIIANPDRDGSGSLIRYHNVHSSRWLLVRPGIILVGVIDNLISQLSYDKQFLFSTVTELQDELKATDLVMSDILRCYGGKDKGIDILFTLRRKPS